MLSSCLTVLFCLSSISAKEFLQHETPQIEQFPPASYSSCSPNEGNICIPTTCSSKVCSLFKNAVCVTDRCGCETRFFRWMSEEKTYRDVSKLCSSANFVFNFVNYTMVQKTWQNDEDPKTILKFYKEFNLLMIEILKDLTDYLRVVSQSNPTKNNIDNLKHAVYTLKSLKQSASGIKIQDLHLDVHPIDQKKTVKIVAGAAVQAGVVGHAGSSLNDVEEDISVKDFQHSSPMENFKGSFIFLKDVLSEQGQFADAVKSGHTAVSDEDAQNGLHLLFHKICASSSTKNQLLSVTPTSAC